MTSAVQAWDWHHTGLSVNSLTRALDFYRESFGFYPVFEALDMSDLIQSVTGVAGLRADLVQCKSQISQQVLELIEFRNVPLDAEINLPIHPGIAHNAFLVPHLETAIAEIQKQGGKLLGQITDFSEGRAVYCRDANGCFLELEEASHEESA